MPTRSDRLTSRTLSSFGRHNFKIGNLFTNAELQKYGIDQPKITNTADGIAVTKTDPQGNVSVTVQPTKPHFEHLEAIGKTMAGLGMDPTVAQLQGVRAMNLPPPVEQHYLQQIRY